MKHLALKAIAAYRRSGGGYRWFGIDCNFEPSCSAYAMGVIERFGLWQGMRLALNRIGRCRQPDSVCKCLEPVPERVPHAQQN